MIFFNFLGDQTDVICQREYYYKTNHQTNKVTASDQTPDMYKHIKIKAKIYNKNKTILLCRETKRKRSKPARDVHRLGRRGAGGSWSGCRAGRGSWRRCRRSCTCYDPPRPGAWRQTFSSSPWSVIFFFVFPFFVFPVLSILPVKIETDRETLVVRRLGVRLKTMMRGG
jgi:hypothetical protein